MGIISRGLLLLSPALAFAAAEPAALARFPAEFAPSVFSGIGEAEEAADPVIVEITATDYAFNAPARVPAGVVTFRMKNTGRELHHALLMRLTEGHTARELMAELEAGVRPEWAVPAGGPNAVPPGMHANATVVLPAGEYVWLCEIPAADGEFHYAKGMVYPMTVEGPGGGVLPDADARIVLTDYAFERPQALVPGHHVIRVRNEAVQAHEVLLVELMPGKKAEDVVHWVESGMQGPPPGLPVGGIAALAQGEANNFEVELKPAEYAFICFLPDHADGRPHFLHGMMETFTVR